MDYPIKCRFCGKEVDSHDSYADSKADLRQHISTHHAAEVEAEDQEPKCVELIDHPVKPGVCGRHQGHPMHLPLGLSSYEHKYKAPEIENDKRIFEVTVLSKRNLKETARRSGKDVEELDTLRRVMRRKGKLPKVKYVLAPGIEPRTISETVVENAVADLQE